MRISELLAIQINSVDFFDFRDNSLIRVQNTLLKSSYDLLI